MHAKAAQLLMRWYRAYGRHELPWRVRRSPYATLVSEMMLQQTQVSRVVEYFERWLARFPDLAALRCATIDEVIVAWQGLGYYRRARSLHALAQEVSILPQDRAALLALPGVGPYTAEAIRAFAFDLPSAPIDTNLRRVLGRLLGPEEGLWQETLAAWQQRRSARALNEALMDFGATVCTSRNPSCLVCPLRAQCASFAANGPLVSEVAKRAQAAKPSHAIALMREGSTPLLRAKGGILRIALEGSPFRAALKAAAQAEFGVEIAVRPACAIIELGGSLTSVHRCTLLLGNVEGFAPIDGKRAAKLSDWERQALQAAKLL